MTAELAGPAVSEGSRQGEDLWIFGYGSLIWKHPPFFEERVPGYIEGYVRRFWQASEDHRGTPAFPGRVVTLIEETYWESLEDDHHRPLASPARVHGACYRIPAALVPAAREALDLREQNGYTLAAATFVPFAVGAEPGSDGLAPVTTTTATTTATATATATATTTRTTRTTPFQCAVYIGLPSNPQFIGLDRAGRVPAAVAGRIYASAGPSGENREYLYMLEEALERLYGPGGAMMEGVDEHVKELGRLCRELEKGEGRMAGKE